MDNVRPLTSQPAGDRDQRIRIVRTKLGTPNEYNEPPESDALYYECWASVMPITGREAFIAEQMRSIVSWKVRILYKDGIDSSMRVLWRGKRLNIEAYLNPDGHRIDGMLLCSEVTTAT